MKITFKDRIRFHLLYALNKLIDLEAKGYNAYISADVVNSALADLNAKNTISPEILDLLYFTSSYVEKEFYYLRFSEDEKNVIYLLHTYGFGMDVNNYNH